MPRIEKFSTSEKIDDVFERAKILRDEQMVSDGKVFTEAQKEQDDARIKKSLEFLFAAGPEFKGYIANKPEIENWREALPYWVNGDGELGVGGANPVKSLVYKSNGTDEVFAVVMPNDLDLPKKFLKKFNLERYNFPEDEGRVIPRTINPGTIAMMEGEQNLIYCVHQGMNDLGYCVNNLGSRNLSYSVSGLHHKKAVENIAQNNADKNIASVTYDGTLPDLEAKLQESRRVGIAKSEHGESKRAPSPIITVREEDMERGAKALNLALMGDHGRHNR